MSDAAHPRHHPELSISRPAARARPDDTAQPGAILLDLDDTILDDSGSVDRAWRMVCRDAARERAGLEAERLFAEILRVRDWYWSDPERHRRGRQDLRAASTQIVLAALTALGHADPDLARAIAHAYRDRRDVATQPLPGAIDALTDLAERKIRLALITNGAGPVQRAKLERFDLTRYFDYILIEGEFGVGKPDERVYRTAMEVLDARPSTTWMVGDNLDWEVVAPQKLGLRTVWVDRAGRGLPPGSPVRPDHVITSLHQLPALLFSEP